MRVNAEAEDESTPKEHWSSTLNNAEKKYALPEGKCKAIVMPVLIPLPYF